MKIKIPIPNVKYRRINLPDFGTGRRKESESCRQADCTGVRRNIKFHYFNIGRLWCSNSESECHRLLNTGAGGYEMTPAELTKKR